MNHRSTVQRHSHCHTHDHDHGHGHDGDRRGGEVQALASSLGLRVAQLCDPVAESHRREVSERDLIKAIGHAVGPGSGLYPELASKVARAIVSSQVSRSEFERVLSVVGSKRRSGVVRNPGAYFVACAKRLFAESGVKW